MILDKAKRRQIRRQFNLCKQVLNKGNMDINIIEGESIIRTNVRQQKDKETRGDIYIYTT